MKSTLMLLPAIAILVSCSSPKTVQRDPGTASQRFNLPDNTGSTTNHPSDTVAIKGTEFIPLLGKSEDGTRPVLEGTWQLQSMNGKTIAESALNAPIPKKVAPGTEIRHDSVTTTEKVKGVTYTTTTAQIDKPGENTNRITPAQSSVYHIPQRPSINFYGSNETFSGFTGCNKFAGRYTVSDTNTINLKTATASTKMVCLGDYDEDAFLNTLRRANAYKAQNNQLQLMEGDNVILVFQRID